jgi:hypothetical protein
MMSSRKQFLHRPVALSLQLPAIRYRLPKTHVWQFAYMGIPFLHILLEFSLISSMFSHLFMMAGVQRRVADKWQRLYIEILHAER